MRTFQCAPGLARSADKLRTSRRTRRTPNPLMREFGFIRLPITGSCQCSIRCVVIRRTLASTMCRTADPVLVIDRGSSAMHQRSCGRGPRIGVRSTTGMTAAPPALPGRACDKCLKGSHEFTCPLPVGGMRVDGRTHCKDDNFLVPSGPSSPIRSRCIAGRRVRLRLIQCGASACMSGRV